MQYTEIFSPVNIEKLHLKIYYFFSIFFFLLKTLIAGTRYCLGKEVLTVYPQFIDLDEKNKIKKIGISPSTQGLSYKSGVYITQTYYCDAFFQM